MQHPGRDLILSTKPFAKEVRWKSWYYTITTILLLIAIFLGTHYMPTFIGKLACSIAAGFVMMRGFVIYHDHQHHSILYKSFIADAIFTVYGLFMLSPTSIWKRSHDYHHNHNSKLFSASIGSYPILTVEKYMNASDNERKTYLASRHPLSILFGYFTMFIKGMCIDSFMSNNRKHWDSLLALILHAAASIFMIVHFGFIAYMLTICIPFFVSLMIGAYLFYAQHNFSGVQFTEKEDWNYAGAALHSSSYLKMNRLMQWLSANIGFHHVHHLNSRIPFYRLPEAMEKVEALHNPTITTFKFSDIRLCLSLKVWDPSQNRMLTMKEVNEIMNKRS
jgi:omega-6 fatty acid desaturase (delta-12 desaturase)